jgi:hypothetical protein
MRKYVLFACISLALSGCAITEPVAVIGKNGQILRGTCHASLAGASFQVTDGRLTCSGSYNGYDTSTTIKMPVSCSDGRKGFVVATRQASGLDGSGKVTLNDGTQADFVFGKDANAFEEKQVAMLQFQERAKSECGVAGKLAEVPRDKIVAATKCMNNLVEQIVMPAATNPDLVAREADAMLILADQYAAGKMSQTEFSARVHEAKLDYDEASKSRANIAMQQAEQNDQRRAEIRALQSAAQAASAPALPPPAPILAPHSITTQCIPLSNGTVTCNSF